MNVRSAQPYFLILPSFLLAAFIILWPLSELTLISTHEVNRFGHLRDFAGFANFSALLEDRDFIATINKTLIWTVGVVGGTLVLSLPVALILNEDFYGRGIARVIVMLPWAVSLTMTAIVWRWALNGEIGLLNVTLRQMGVLDENIQWLAQASTAFPVQIFIGILVSVPFCVTVFLGGLSSIQPDLYEAAAVEGAGRWQQFREITLPLLRPFINIALVLMTIYVFNSFPIIWAMTQGGPANSTDIMVTYLYKLAFRWGSWARPPLYRSSCSPCCWHSRFCMCASSCAATRSGNEKAEAHRHLLGAAQPARRHHRFSVRRHVRDGNQTASGDF